MSALLDDPGRHTRRLRELVREADALGVAFRFAGDTIAIACPEVFPGPLREALAAWNAKGWLYPYLGGTRRDEPAIAFAKALDVTPVLVETRDALRWAIATLEADMKASGNRIAGIDIETFRLPQYAKPSPAIRITADGIVYENTQADEENDATNPHTAAIACLQIYCGGRSCFLFRDEPLHWVVRSRWLRTLDLVAHNAGFESAFLQSAVNGHRITVPRHRRGSLHCTQQLAGLVIGTGFGGERRNLENTAKTVLKLDVPKSLQRSEWGAKRLSRGQICYACNDSVLAYRLHPELLKRRDAISRRTGVNLGAAYKLQLAAIPSVVAMERVGLGFDAAEHRRQVDGWASQLQHRRREYTESTRLPPPANRTDVRQWLEVTLRPDPQRLARWPRTRTGLLSTSHDHLVRLGDLPGARPVLEILALETLLQDFGVEAMQRHVCPATQRLHAHYNIAATKSGRFSASKPNLQQLPSSAAKDFKRCIVARPGYVLIVADYNQIELRATAHIVPEPSMTRIYMAGGDMHAVTGARMAGVALDAVTPEQRQRAKPVNFGIIYGMGPPALASYAFSSYGVAMSVPEAGEVRQRFFADFPQLRPWQWDQYRRCEAQGYVAIGAGRIVAAAWEPNGEISFTQAANLPIQGAAADCTLRALKLIHQSLTTNRIRGGLACSVHDEFVCEILKDDAEVARALIAEAMVQAFKDTFRNAPTRNLVAIGIADNWKDAKP
jgi:DNA polymerase-1